MTKHLSRRRRSWSVKIVLAGFATMAALTGVWLLMAAESTGKQVTVILSTDLLEDPIYGDLDDHFDLPMAYSGALPAPVGAIHLDAGWITRPPGIEDDPTLQPGTRTLARLEEGYDYVIPVVNGSRTLFDASASPDPIANALAAEIERLAPVTFVVTGTARDLAWTLLADPQLAASGAIRSVWIVAGDADTSRPPAESGEWNAAADPGALAFVLDSEIPTVWIPPFDGGPWTNHGNASWFEAPVSALFEKAPVPVRDAMVLAWNREWSDREKPTASEVGEYLSGTKSLWLSGLLTLLDPSTGMLAPIPGVLETERVSVDVDPLTGAFYTGSAPVDRLHLLDAERYATEMVERHADAVIDATP